MMNQKKNIRKKVVKIGIMPIILCIIAIFTIINICNPEIQQTIHETRIRSLHAEQGYEAQIGEGDSAVPYATLIEAITAANPNDKIVVLSDITLNEALTIDKNIEIDLNECKIYTKEIVNNGNLILSNGVIYGTLTPTTTSEGIEDTIFISNNGVLSLANISITNNTGTGIQNDGELNFNDENVVITGKTTIVGGVDSVRVNHAVKITKSTEVNYLYIATVVNMYDATTTETILCRNILYNNIYSAFESIEEYTDEQVEILLLKDVPYYGAGKFVIIGENQNILLNLNNYSLGLNSTGSGQDAGIINNGLLTVINGTITEQSSNYRYKLITNNGTLNANNLNLYYRSSSDYSYLYNYGKATLSGTLNFRIENGKNNITDCEVNINNATSTGGISTYGTLNIDVENTNPENRTTINGFISGSTTNTITIGNEKRTTDNRPIINANLSGYNIIINNAEVNGRVTVNSRGNLHIKDGVFTQLTEFSVIEAQNAANIIIEKGEIICGASKNSIHLDYVGNSGEYTNLTIGTNDGIVNHDLPILRGGLAASGTIAYMTGWKLYDGIIYLESGLNFYTILEGFGYERNGENIFSENPEYKYICEQQEDGKYIFTLKDFVAPTVNLGVVRNECTYDSIKLNIEAEDAGDGVDKYIVYYRDKSQTEQKQLEFSWGDSKEKTREAVIPDLEIGTVYEIKVEVYDKGGNVTTPTIIEGSTTSGINSITINPTTLTLEEGEIGNITATINPSNAINQSIEWKSSDPTVATVEDGVVTAVSAGRTTITAETVDGGKTATCGVIVTESTIPVTGISLDKTEITMETLELQTLTATVYPENATNKNVIWTSSDESIVKVNENGTILTYLELGTATITATTVDGGYTATCTVTVVESAVPVTGVSLDKTSLNLVEGNSEILTATVNPSNATNKDVIWSSSEPSVATVNQSGKITAMREGIAIITATTDDGGYTATCNVTVTKGSAPIVSVTGVSLDKTILSLVEGDTETLTATVNPSNATNKDVTWSSSEASVVTVNQNGKITAMREGTATITVTTADGGYTATCTVTVTKGSAPIVSVTGVILNRTSLNLIKGNTEILTATVNPSNATNKDVTWSSSEPSVATVNQNGKITAIGEGTTTITVTTADGGYTATCNVTVTEPVVSVTGVILNKTSLNLEKGNTETLTATINPSNATNKDVTWSSSEASVATVDGNGKVTAVGEGTATITVTTVDGGKIATCEVTVTDLTQEPDPKPDVPGDEYIDLESISINKTEISLYTGESQTLKLTINPSNATIEKIIYTSSNIDVATVDENGRIMAKGKGTSTITVVVVDKNGNSLSEECKVTVKKTEVPDKDGDSGKDKDKDTTTADKILPSTGLGKAILAGTIVLIINGIVMLVKYRKMKDI